MGWWSSDAGTVDDRGRVVDPARAEVAIRVESASGQVDPELREIWRRMGAIPRRQLMMESMSWLMIAGILALTFAMVIGSMAAPGLGLPQWSAAIIPAVVGLTFPFIVRATTRTSRFGRSIEMYTYYGRCPQCLSSLRGLNADWDGCVVCPECAAAWRASRIAPAHVLDALRATDPAPTPARPTPDHRDGAGWTWPPRRAPVTVLDAFARPVPLAAADLSNLNSAELAEIPRLVRQRLTSAAGGLVDRVIGLAWRAAVIAMLLWLAYLQMARSLPLRFTVESIGGLMAGVMFTFLAVFFSTSLPRLFARTRVVRVRRFVQAMLAADRCPSCVASMVDVEREVHEGRDVWRCPRCAAEWAAGGEVIAPSGSAWSRAR
ncbi:MAG: hypothetical protein K2X32_13775 [Phycisphaerales bacterium]|nr:hypothetical protein [Phycisphaerales bacterium]